MIKTTILNKLVTYVEAISSIAAVLVALALFIRNTWRGIWFFGLTDETTHLLGGRVIDAGGILYRDFVDNHGPVIYALTSAYGALIGWSDPNLARLIPVLMVVGAGAAVAASPALSTRTDRASAGAAFFGMVAVIWLLQGFHLVSFYPAAGAFSVIVIASFWIPVCLGSPVPDATALISGIAAAALGFTAYSFMPTAALFAISAFLAAGRRGNYRPAVLFILGGIAGIALMFVWLARFADIPGYFAFHIAFNQTAFQAITPLSLRSFLASFKPALEPRFLVQDWAVAAFALGGSLLLICMRVREKRGFWIVGSAWMLGIAGIAILNIFGAWSLKNGTFVLASLGLFAVMLPAARPVFATPRRTFRIVLPVTVLILLGLSQSLLRHATTSPYAMDAIARSTVRVTRIASYSNDPLSERIRSIVPAGDKFLALVYRPDLYWAADRLPMPGFFAYFPWDAAYARSPWFGRPRDLCTAMAEHPPKLIAFDIPDARRRFGDLTYLQCVEDALDTHYHPILGFPSLYSRQAIAEPP